MTTLLFQGPRWSRPSFILLSIKAEWTTNNPGTKKVHHLTKQYQGFHHLPVWSGHFPELQEGKEEVLKLRYKELSKYQMVESDLVRPIPPSLPFTVVVLSPVETYKGNSTKRGLQIVPTPKGDPKCRTLNRRLLGSEGLVKVVIFRYNCSELVQ